MPSDPLVHVVDANILIDLYVGRVLWEISRLPFAFVAPDLLVYDLQQPSGQMLIDYHLVSPVELSGERVQEVVRLRSVHPDLSVYDCSAFVLSKTLGVTLLSGDGGLRQLAEDQGIPVHGTLWVLDQMLEGQMINHKLASAALEIMGDGRNSRRLPVAECKSKLRLWKALSKY